MTTIYFAGNELMSHASWLSCSDNAEGADTTWTPSAMRLTDTAGYVQSHPWSAATADFWFHGVCGEHSGNTWSGSAVPYTFYNSSGTAVLRLTGTGTGDQLRIQYWNGSAWTNLGTSTVTVSGTSVTWDIHVDIDVGVDVYLNGSLAFSEALDMTPYFTDIQYHRLGFFYNSAGRCGSHSQIIVADEPTITYRYKSNPPTGDSSTNTAWTGTYADVDEIPMSLTDNITSDTANQVETFTAAARTFTGYAIKQVLVYGYGLKGASGPGHVQGALRIGSTNYFTSDINLDYGYGTIKASWDTDPSTGVAWTASAAGDAALEFGFKSTT